MDMDKKLEIISHLQMAIRYYEECIANYNGMGDVKKVDYIKSVRRCIDSANRIIADLSNLG